MKSTRWSVDDENESVAGGVYLGIDDRLSPLSMERTGKT